MKSKPLFLAIITASCLLTSCATVFTGSKQDVTFKGVQGTDLLDNKGRKVGEIGKNGFATIPLRKKIGSKKITARLDGYAPREVEVKSKFNPISLANIVVPVPWIIDLCTGKICKYSGDVVDVTLVQTDNTGVSGNGYIENSNDGGWIE